MITERDRYGVNSIKPGLTGWAQINGRDELLIHVKVMFDFQYKKNVNIKLDILCLVKTISSIIKSDGVFEGSKKLKGLTLVQ